jgi:hypothetical protein
VAVGCGVQRPLQAGVADVNGQKSHGGIIDTFAKM